MPHFSGIDVTGTILKSLFFKIAMPDFKEEFIMSTIILIGARVGTRRWQTESNLVLNKFRNWKQRLVTPVEYNILRLFSGWEPLHLSSCGPEMS